MLKVAETFSNHGNIKTFASRFLDLDSLTYCQCENYHFTKHLTADDKLNLLIFWRNTSLKEEATPDFLLRCIKDADIICRQRKEEANRYLGGSIQSDGEEDDSAAISCAEDITLDFISDDCSRKEKNIKEVISKNELIELYFRISFRNFLV